MVFLFNLISYSINFWVHPVVYRPAITIQDSNLGNVEVFYLEFNCGIPYQELFYEEIDGTIIARTMIELKIQNLAKADSFSDTLYRQFTIPSFSQAAREKIKFIVQFGLYILEGEYLYTININSGKNDGTKTGNIFVDKEDYLMSDLLLASSITSDTTGGYLTKGNLRIIPQVFHIFDEKTKNLYVYYELYDIAPDTVELMTVYQIMDAEKKIHRKITRQLKKAAYSEGVNLGINIESLSDGEYTFQIEVFDSSLTSLIKKEAQFTIKRQGLREGYVEEPPHYRDIEYFISPDEYKQFLSLNDSGKVVYLRKFWSKHNYDELAPRFEYADRHFSEGNKLGSKTDRGRIYIKYGEPDEIERSTMGAEEVKPYEHWQYYNGLEFIFVDVRGTNEYLLVWTNSHGERNKPFLYIYLPSTKRKEIEEK